MDNEPKYCCTGYRETGEHNANCFPPPTWLDIARLQSEIARVYGLRNAVYQEIPEIVQEALGDAQLADWFWDELGNIVERRQNES